MPMQPNLDEEQEAYFVDIIEKEIKALETSEQLDKVQETIAQKAVGN